MQQKRIKMKLKKLLLLTIIFCSSALAVIAQKVIFVEPRFILKSLEPEVTTFTHNNKNYVLYESLNMKSHLRLDIQLDSYSPDGKSLKSAMVDGPGTDAAEPNYFSGIFPVGTQLTLFKNGYENKTKITTLYAYPLEDDGSKGDQKEIGTIQGVGMINSGTFKVDVSPDGQKVVVLRQLPHAKEGNEKIILNVYDKDLKTIAEKEIEFPYESSKNALNVAMVNNAGNVFIIKKIFAKKGTTDREMIFTFAPDLTLIKETPHEIGTIGITTSYKTTFDAAGNLVFAGFYSDYKKVGINVSGPEGAFCSKITPAGELTSTTSVLSLNTNIKISQLLPATDGGYFIVAEQQSKKDEQKPGGTPFETNSFYTTQSGLLIKFGADTKKQWDYIVRRGELTSMNDNAKDARLSAAVGPDGNLYVIYKDHWSSHDGVDRTVILPPVSGWRGDIIEVFDPNGKPLKKSLIRDERIGGPKGQYYLLPQTFRVLPSGELLGVSFRTLELVSTKIVLE